MTRVPDEWLSPTEPGLQAGSAYSPGTPTFSRLLQQCESPETVSGGCRDRDRGFGPADIRLPLRLRQTTTSGAGLGTSAAIHWRCAGSVRNPRRVAISRPYCRLKVGAPDGRLKVGVPELAAGQRFLVRRLSVGLPPSGGGRGHALRQRRNSSAVLSLTGTAVRPVFGRCGEAGLDRVLLDVADYGRQMMVVTSVPVEAVPVP